MSLETAVQDLDNAATNFKAALDAESLTLQTASADVEAKHGAYQASLDAYNASHDKLLNGYALLDKISTLLGIGTPPAPAVPAPANDPVPPPPAAA